MRGAFGNIPYGDLGSLNIEKVFCCILDAPKTAKLVSTMFSSPVGMRLSSGTGSTLRDASLQGIPISAMFWLVTLPNRMTMPSSFGSTRKVKAKKAADCYDHRVEEEDEIAGEAAAARHNRP